MATTRRTIIGTFEQPAMADQALNDLRMAGFTRENMHRSGPDEQSSGGFMAGIKNFFTGDSMSSGMADREVADMGLSNDEIEYYERESRAGHMLLAVHTHGRDREVADILRSNGASLYSAPQSNSQPMPDASASQRTKQAANPKQGLDRSRSNRADDNDEQRRLKLREEQLTAEKQRVQTGEAILHKEIIAEQKTIDVPVTHEEVIIQQRAITGGAVSDNTPIGEGESIRVPVSEERVNVKKETRVTGEASLGKRSVEENQRITDTVRHEEARVEQKGDAPIHNKTSDRVHRDNMKDDVR